MRLYGLILIQWMMLLFAGVTQGSDSQKGATGLPGIRGNMVRIHITLHPVDIIYLIDHTKWSVLNKTTAAQSSEFIPLSLSRVWRAERVRRESPGLEAPG